MPDLTVPGPARTATPGRCPVSGPLEGVRIVELAGLGPAPFAGMMLADAGADIIRIDRSDRATYPPMEGAHVDLMNRGRRSVAVDLKHPDGVALVLDLVAGADGLMEGFRRVWPSGWASGPRSAWPATPARLRPDDGLGPGRAHGHDRRPRHRLHRAVGRTGRHRPRRRAAAAALNLVGDFGGGGMLLAFGMLAAILSARTTGAGQVVDAAMVDGSAALMAMTYTLRSAGVWQDERGTNMLDTGAHFYEVYECADGGYFGVGAIEPQFYAELMGLLGLGHEDLSTQLDRTTWPAMKERFAAIFATRTAPSGGRLRRDRCLCGARAVAGRGARPSAQPGPGYLHRGRRRGPTRPRAAVRFDSREIRRPPPHPGQYGDDALADWGVSEQRVSELRSSGAIR